MRSCASHRLERLLEILDHRQLRVGEVAEHESRRDVKARDRRRTRSFSHSKATSSSSGVSIAPSMPALVKQLLRIAVTARTPLPTSAERRVDLELADDRELELLLRGAPGR